MRKKIGQFPWLHITSGYGLVSPEIKPISRGLFYGVLILILSGCGSRDSREGSDMIDAKSIDLTGTWIMTVEERRTNINTGVYQGSAFIELKYLLEDDLNGVKFDRCWEYGGPFPPVGTKTDSHLYMFPASPTNPGFSILDSATMEKVTTFELAWDPGYTYEAIQTMERVSRAIEIDNGTLILNGPVSISEYSHACTWKHSNNTDDTRTLEIIAPFDDDSLNFNFRTSGDIAPGTYYYNDSQDARSIFLNVISNASAFWTVTGSNNLSPRDVTINVIVSTDSIFSGTFSFLGQDNERYTGEFEIILSN